MVTANECTRHICYSRKNSLSCAKSTSIGRNKNKLWAGSANAQINPSVTTWGTFISTSWCGQRMVRWWSWSGSKGFSHACLCQSITEYTVEVAPFSLSPGNYSDNKVELITSEVKENLQSVCNIWIVCLKTIAKATIFRIRIIPQTTPCYFVHLWFWKLCWCGPFNILEHAVQ